MQSQLSRRDEFLANADKCLVLADLYDGTLSAVTLRAAAGSWRLLADLEAGRTATLAARGPRPAREPPR